jgi:hypothetical protein
MKKQLNLQNVDLRTVRTGRAWVHESIDFVVRVINTAFTAPGAVVFVVGLLAGLGLVARHG